MDVKQAISDMIDRILSSENSEAGEMFNNIISVKTNDAINDIKQNIAQNLYKEGNDSEQEELEVKTADDNTENTED